MEINFKQDGYFKNMDFLEIDGKRQTLSIPRWLFEMLPDDKMDVAKNCLKEVFIAGFNEGKNRKSKEVKDLINKLQNI